MHVAFLDLGLRTQFRRKLLRWFDREKRTLPWRGESDPYRILVSEIMLQQTRVAVVTKRYKQFLRKFPTVSRLARASESSVLAAWSGLGYYRRARNLQAAAKHIHSNGRFPTSAAELTQLPGIGRYTAAAVASIAFSEAVAVVDGNVKRVIRRLTGKAVSDESCWKTAQELLEVRQPGDFNQAMMELGATICLSGMPVCGRCPVAGFCRSRADGRSISASQARTPALQRRKETLRYLLARRNGSILLEKRPAEASLMPGMWELPPFEINGAKMKAPILTLRHSITTTDYTVLIFEGLRGNSTAKWIPLSSVNRLPLTGLARKALHGLQLV